MQKLPPRKNKYSNIKSKVRSHIPSILSKEEPIDGNMGLPLKTVSPHTRFKRKFSKDRLAAEVDAYDSIRKNMESIAYRNVERNEFNDFPSVNQSIDSSLSLNVKPASYHERSAK